MDKNVNTDWLIFTFVACCHVFLQTQRAAESWPNTFTQHGQNSVSTEGEKSHYNAHCHLKLQLNLLHAFGFTQRGALQITATSFITYNLLV